jgi:hypothetical protein
MGFSVKIYKGNSHSHRRAIAGVERKRALLLKGSAKIKT